MLDLEDEVEMHRTQSILHKMHAKLNQWEHNAEKTSREEETNELKEESMVILEKYKDMTHKKNCIAL